ncbi:MAG: hypothetical protein K6G03_05585 [Lachnospiraceae bacterium]|nr:hypothetical protein [Lachnospiraceae bacterium]
MKKSLMFLLFISVLVTVDYFLFHNYELVFPFFILPYVIMCAIYVSMCVKGKREFITGKLNVTDIRFTDAVYLLIIIPVLSGLVMSIGWMFKINFFRDITRGLFG